MEIALQSLDWVILIGYFVILLGIGIWASSKRKKGSSLFLAEKSLRWHHIGFSMWGTNVGPSMLIASASAGYLSGIGSGNYAWYAFILIALLTFVFIPKYLGSNISTLPEFMGKRFGEKTRNILAWYTIVTVVISWLALQLFAGGKLLEQFFNIPIWASALILLCLSAFISMLGGLKALAYTNVYQMVLLIVVSATLTIVGINKVGGLQALYNGVPEDFWHLWRPNDDAMYPAVPLFLGYLVSGVWFWCTDQSMVQPVLAARSIEEGQKGTNFTGWLKILDVFLYIVPGIICYVMSKQGLIVGNGAPELADKAYMTLVMNLFPIGMVGLIFAILTAALVSTIGSALNALSTVFTMDIYCKSHPEAKGEEIVKTGRIVTVVGGIISIAITIAIYNIKGIDFFNIFQSVLGFIAPPMAAVFLMGVFWKKTSSLAANFALTAGTIISIGTGILYLWVLPPSEGYNFWPHFMLLSFVLCIFIMVCMVIISMIDSKSERLAIDYGNVEHKTTTTVKVLWATLAAVMIFLYWFFN